MEKYLGAVILAAGRSSRMGAFKPLLPLGNTSFIQRIVQNMRQAGAAKIVVVTGCQAEQLENHLSGQDLIFVKNEEYDHSQMLDSVKLGLNLLQQCCERVLLTPVDVPLPAVDTYQALLKAEGDFVRPVYQNRPGHPVVLTQAVIWQILCYNGPGGLKGAVEASGCFICDCTVNDPAVVMDADTPEEYEALKKYNTI